MSENSNIPKKNRTTARRKKSTPDSEKGQTVFYQPKKFSDTSEKKNTPTRSNKPAKSYSPIEKIAIAILILILLFTGVYSALFFKKNIDSQSYNLTKVDLPVEGKLVKITSISTYWIEPTTEGENADLVRYGAKAIPVVDIKASGEGVLRIFFRNQDGELIGDSKNETIFGETLIKTKATDGFSDLGMHAAYRTSSDAPWIVEIFEGPSIEATGEHFTLLAKSKISTDFR